MDKKIITFVHHGVEVKAREDLQGKHREYCLCFSCKNLNIEDREKNCPIANELYDNCIKFQVTTPVFYCEKYVSKIVSKLSKTEQELLDFITTSIDRVDIALIKQKLGTKHVGGLGRLLGRKLIEGKKYKSGEGYSTKYMKYYILVKLEV